MTQPTEITSLFNYLQSKQADIVRMMEAVEEIDKIAIKPKHHDKDIKRFKKTGRKLTVEGIEITAFTDGSIEKPFHGAKKRTFGTKTNKGNMTTCIGGKAFQVHRLIAKAFISDFCDYPMVEHIDCNQANNKISNLRMTNCANTNKSSRRRLRGCSSKYRGVSFVSKSQMWNAGCKINGKSRHIGNFESAKEAAVARDAYAFSHGFPVESLNFPKNYK